MGTENIKYKFTNWLLKNAPESYSFYLGISVNSVEEKLNEINSYFPEIDLFRIENGNPEKIISFINNKIANKEARLKNPAFAEYDKKKSNGIPKAVIGKRNYIKFLKEYFSNKCEINYWIFQGSPEIYDIERALRAGHLKSWKIAAHKDKIKPGDKVILWQTGNKAGCYALAEVISEVGEIVEEEYEKQYYRETEISEIKEDRVKIKITKYLADDPVLWRDIKELPEFENFKAGNQGTNFSATREEFESFLNLTELSTSSEYWKVKKLFPKGKVEKYLNVLRNFLEDNQISPKDERISFNVRPDEKRLVFLIGNRYALSIEMSNGDVNYSVIHPEIISAKYGKFTNRAGQIEAYWNHVETLFGIEDKIEEGFKIELDRNYKSPYRKLSNQEFIADIMQTKTESNDVIVNNKLSLNTILYGPPGTGKTFKLQDTYFERFTVKESSLSRKQFLENLISELTWWQVISVVMVDLKSAKINEIYDHELIRIKEGLSKSESVKQTLWGQLQTHTKTECENVGYKGRSEPLYFWKDGKSIWTIDEDLVKDLYPEAFKILEESKNYEPNPDKSIKNYEFVTFHQSFSYEDFVEGIKPKLEEQESDLSYEIKDGVFKKLCLKAIADPENNYALFIDEINRGNVSAIFGELITLIEKDKRIGQENELKVKLPYSKKEFGVPDNLYIFGTMNTADRSVEALDTALRRRFAFEEVMPLPQILGAIQFSEFNLAEVLKIINERIEVLLDRDHTIGHSYFIKIMSGDVHALKEAFENKIIPLLQEYFYHDYEKIALILGEGFVERKEANVSFAKFDNLDEPELLHSFELRKDVGDVEAAVKKLLNRGDEETA